MFGCQNEEISLDAIFTLEPRYALHPTRCCGAPGLDEVTNHALKKMDAEKHRIMLCFFYKS